jgi:hypothetical protein
MRNGLAVLLLFSLIVPAVGGADTFRYETEEGILSFTDDLKRVPARYRASAEKIPTRSLWTYPRLTPVARGATTHARWTAEVQPEAAMTEQAAPSKQTLSVQVAPGLWVQLDPEQEAPLRVEREYRWFQGAFRPHTVVRQGDRVLAVRLEG